MIKNDHILYHAFKSKDPRFDGRFFVGISSTGIYCRPVCRAKQPKEENCTFFSSAAEAEQAGYRPCLLCRPELAPGTSTADASFALAQKAARILEENCDSRQSLEELAATLGCTGRHLRRVFMEEYHVTPIQYLQTCRLLLAKNLLTDTGLSVLDIAMTAGFGSLRRFNELFQKRYQLSPTALRRNAAGGKRRSGEITVSLGYRAPYYWEALLKFFAGRAISGVELVKDNEYMRTVQLYDKSGKECSGWMRVGNNPGKHVLDVTVSESLIPVLQQILVRVRRLFDLYCNPQAVYETLQVMNELQPGLCVLGARVPGCFDPFEMSVRAILGQQITVKAAGTLAGRIAKKYGMPVDTEIEGLACIFPSAEKILFLGEKIEDQLGALGVIASRSRTIQILAEALSTKKLHLDYNTRPEDEIKKLMELRGIGSWTAQYIAMRAMGYTDAFLETDAGVKKALPAYAAKEMLALAKVWRPWRSYATVNLWNSL